MSRHHVVITGTGRAGTTFLIQLMTALGMPTGFRERAADIYPLANAGMERDIRDRHAPYVVKSPWLCDQLDEVLADHDIAIDHVLVPVRDLFSAAESRRAVSRASGHEDAPGGLWDTPDPEQQEDILTTKLYKLIYTLAKHDIPVTLLHFPRITRDADYLYEKLKPLLGLSQRWNFHDAFQQVVKPALVHDFKPRSQHMTKSASRSPA
ncbi:hypothetical protein [Solilutibacter silvestris]|uniref:hypothetical protein n=1 Tax=Solilutibacter silvestris TaxID=1645665 RepID=UPI003D32B9E8